MELKEYLKMFKDNYQVFFITLGVVLVVGLSFQLVIKNKYKAEVDLNVTRTGYQKDTSDYRYDEFYRLQADERFADTLVRWLGSVVIKNDISKEVSGILFEKLKAERLSSQMIKVSFLIYNQEDAKQVTQAINEVLNKNIAELNLEQKNPQWFKVLVSYPVVNNYEPSWIKLIGILLVIGFFLGFWTVLIRHYLK